jgi:acyl carrier protein
MKDLFLKHFAEAIERSSGMNFEDDFKSYEEWDSLAILSLLAVVDEEYGVNFSSSQLEKMKTVGDVYEFILDKSK